jgi:hypothetical protein
MAGVEGKRGHQTIEARCPLATRTDMEPIFLGTKSRTRLVREKAPRQIGAPTKHRTSAKS